MKEYIRHILDMALLFSKSVSQDCSPAIRPFVKVITYLGTLLFMLIVIPIALPFSFAHALLNRLRPQSLSTFMRLEQELQSIWYSESSVKALHSLREVHQKLSEDDRQGLLKGITIAPYGKFTFNDYLQVLWLLYNYEVSHQHWEQAKDVCDVMLLDLNGEESRLMRNLPLNQEWIARKAKMIVKLEGTTHAQNYLLPYLVLEEPENPITLYFHELRNSTLSTKSRIEGQQKDSDDHIMSERKHPERQDTNIVPFPSKDEN